MQFSARYAPSAMRVNPYIFNCRWNDENLDWRNHLSTEKGKTSVSRLIQHQSHTILDEHKKHMTPLVTPCEVLTAVEHFFQVAFDHER